MIDVNVSSKVFGNTPVLQDVSFSLSKGERMAIVGPSGIGKSTLLRIAVGLDQNFEGHVSRPENMAMVFQEPMLLPWRSVMDNITLIHDKLTSQEAVHVLGQVGLEGKADMYPGQLSLGQQRRLALARAFAAKPDLLIMDEPFVSLDDETSQMIQDLTAKFMDELDPIVLFVTHAIQEAERFNMKIVKLAGKPATLEEKT